MKNGGGVVYLAYKLSDKKYFRVNNIIEYDKNKNFIFKLLYKIFGSNNLLKWQVRKINPVITILECSNDLKILKNNKSKKILVQHQKFENEMKILFFNEEEINKIKKEIDCFVCLSDYDRDRFIKELDFPKDKIRTIRHSCEVELRKTHKEKNKELIIISRLENIQKRLDLAIKGMVKLKDFKLKIWGDGLDKEKYKDLIEEYKLEDRVFLMGPTNKVQEKLDESGIFIMTSDYEGYPIALIEAMRRGLPIVLRNMFDAAQDIVVNNQNGILLEKEWNEDKFVEAVKKIYNNYEYYSENSRKLGERYNFEIIQKKWEDLANDLLQGE